MLGGGHGGYSLSYAAWARWRGERGIGRPGNGALILVSALTKIACIFPRPHSKKDELNFFPPSKPSVAVAATRGGTVDPL